MTGQRAPLSAVSAIADRITTLAARVSELERVANTPFIPAGYVSSAPTDANGYVTITHQLPFTPSAILATPKSSNHTQHRVDQVTATEFRYRAWDESGTPVASQSITFQWIAAR
jgi:hypothetical protein